MGAVTLTRADIALWSSPVASRVVLNRLSNLSQPRTLEMTGTRFEGDKLATGFVGEGQKRDHQLVARFLASEHALAAALVDLFDAAFVATDPRLLLRTHLGTSASLNTLESVLVPTWTPNWVGAGVVDVSFTAFSVTYTLAV